MADLPHYCCVPGRSQGEVRHSGDIWCSCGVSGWENPATVCDIETVKVHKSAGFASGYLALYRGVPRLGNPKFRAKERLAWQQQLATKPYCMAVWISCMQCGSAGAGAAFGCYLAHGWMDGQPVVCVPSGCLHSCTYDADSTRSRTKKILIPATRRHECSSFITAA